MKKKINEENRPLFTKVTKKVKDQYKENILSGIPKEAKDSGNIINEIISDIDNGFDIIIKTARANIKINAIRAGKDDSELSDEEINKLEFWYEEIEKLKFSDEEIRKIVLGIDKVEEIKKISNIENLDTDTFLESVLKMYNKKIIDSNISLKTYNEDLARLIKTNFWAKLNAVVTNKNNPKSRMRTKESIFDKIDDGKICSMSIKDFSVGYDEIIYLYDIFEDRIKNIEELVEFYNIESKFNLVFYINIALDLFEDTSLGKKELAEQVSKLALLDICIYRSSTMKSIINRIIYAFNKNDKVYQEIYTDLNNLLKLKNTIVKDLLLVNSLVFEDLKEEAFNIISDDAKKEIYSQIQKVDIEKYLHIENDEKMLHKILKNIKYLLENNRVILLERNSIINKFQD